MRVLDIHIIITSFLVALGNGDQCDSGWVQHEQTCFRLYENIHKTWFEARAYCISKNAHLATIPDQETDEFLNSFLKGYLIRPHVSPVDVWIGLTDFYDEGNFEWVDTYRPLRFTDWAHGQPDNNHTEDCAKIWIENYSLQWADDTCGNLHPFVCEKNVYQVPSCRGTFSPDFKWGSLPSPYAVSSTHGKQHCGWLIRVGQGYGIELHSSDNIQGMIQRQFYGCDYFSIKIYEVLSNGHHKARGSWCGEKTVTIFAPTLVLRVEFTSNYSYSETGFLATWVKRDIDECKTDNGGCAQLCKNTPGSWECYCHIGFIKRAKDCIDPCSNITCQHGGFCFSLGNSYKCSCTSGWTGELCNETKEGEDKDLLCDPGWTQYNRSCFRLFTKPESWFNARAHCITENAHLATIPDEETNLFLRSKYFNPDTASIWIGLTDFYYEGYFEWMDSYQPVRYTDWWYKEPDDSQDQDCVDIWNAKDNHWDDYYCRNNNGFLCEKSLDKVPSCGGKFTKEFQWGSLPSPYSSNNSGVQHCEWTIDVGGRYNITLNSSGNGMIDEKFYDCHYFTMKIIEVLPDGQNRSRGLWCGKEALSISASTLILDVDFSSNYTFKETGLLATWHKEDIDECEDNNGGCAQTCLNTPGSWECLCYNDFLWTAGGCLEVKCPTGWSHSYGKCVKYFHDSKPWDEARLSCQAEGGDLVVIRNVVENNLLRDMNNGHNVWWIGLHRVGEQFRWLDDPQEAQFTLWDKNQPDYAGSNENCIELTGSHDSRWNDYTCSKTIGYICERNAIPKIPSFCPSNWTKLNETCFRLFYEKKNWTEANNFCLAEMGHLAIIENVETTDFLNNKIIPTMNGDFWIGLNNIASKHEFVWLNSTQKAGYTNWAPHEPNDTLDGQDCVDIETQRGHKWNADSCSLKKGFLCQKPAIHEKACGGKFDTSHGYLMSPNYPYDYPGDQFCQWEIQTPGGANVTLYFNQLFDLKSGTDCAWDFIEIFRGVEKVGQWCNKNQPPPVVSWGEKLRVVFKSDETGGGKGFFASWK